jgi:sugar phosphate isomerase/epimerase
VGWEIKTSPMAAARNIKSPSSLTRAFYPEAFHVIERAMKTSLPFLICLLVVFALVSSANPGHAELPGTNMDQNLKGRTGLQLYSLRDQFAKSVPKTLDQVRDFGIKYVETHSTYGLTPEKFRAELDSRGLKAVAGHFSYERFRDDTQGVAREAKILGLEYAGSAWIPHKDQFDEKACREAILVFNRAGEALAKHGLKFFYHTHGYEFLPYANGTFFDLMMAETKPQFVTYEIDVFWVVHPGHDPAKLLEKYGSRFELMHVKDMKRGTPTGLFTGHSDVTNNVVLGTGVIDWVAVFKASRKADVKWYFLEDESPTSVQQIPQSLSYMEKLKL